MSHYIFKLLFYIYKWAFAFSFLNSIMAWLFRLESYIAKGTFTEIIKWYIQYKAKIWITSTNNTQIGGPFLKKQNIYCEAVVNTSTGRYVCKETEHVRTGNFRALIVGHFRKLWQYLIYLFCSVWCFSVKLCSCYFKIKFSLPAETSDPLFSCLSQHYRQWWKKCTDSLFK